MAYVATKGGEQAIAAAHAWLAEQRRGDPAVPDLGVAQIGQQLGRAVDRVMAEGSLFDRDLAALAIKQAQGDLIEAAFLLRAYRTTLPRFATSEPVETGGMTVARRVSAIYKDLPAARCWGRPTTTRIACWISRSLRKAPSRRRGRERRRASARARDVHPGRGGPDRAGRREPAGHRPHARAAGVPRRAADPATGAGAGG